jgi:murein DD-endopeptidase MepM/ murein hydrolase activator NlpD
MADNIPSLDDLLKDIREEGEPQSSSALAVVPKKPEDLVEEDIDSQILSILGLEEVFDLTYEEYASLLKEAAVKGRMPDSQMTTESIELVTNELKRVRNKTGRFKVKPKKVDINKVLDRKQPTPSGAIVKAQKLIPQAAEVAPEQEKKPVVDTENLQKDLLNGIGNILESLITIRTLLSSQGKTEQKAAQEDRKETEKKKKKERESTLEKKKPKSPILKALTKPVDDFFDVIKRFFKNVLLGSVVLAIFKWLKDPKNKQAIDDFTNFIENNLDKIFNGILALIGLRIGWNIFKWTRRLYKAFDFLKNKLPGGKPKPPKTPKAPTPSTPKVPSGPKIRPGGGVLGMAAGMVIESVLGDVIKKYVTDPLESKSLETKLKDYSELPTDEKRKERVTLIKERIKELEKHINSPLHAIEKGIALGGETQSEKNLRLNKALLESIQSYDKKIVSTKPQVQPQTSKVPGLPPSAAQPGTGPTGNQVGSPTTIVKPVISGRYGEQRSTGAHGGTDLAVDKGTPLTAVSDGEIVDYGDLNQSGAKRGDPGGWGNFLVYKDDQGIYHLYGHIQDGFKKSGKIKKGEQIAKVGMTGRTSGPHLHWEAGTAWSGGTLSGKFDPLNKYSSTAPFSLNPSAAVAVESPTAPAAQVAKTPAPTPSIPSPTGRGNIVPLPIPTGGGAQQSSSGTAPNQAPVPRFSSEDPNNTTTMVVRAIYNIVG